MNARPFPAWDYRVQDKSDTRLAELEAALLDANDTAAALREEFEYRLNATLDLRDRQWRRIRELSEQARETA